MAATPDKAAKAPAKAPTGPPRVQCPGGGFEYRCTVSPCKAKGRCGDDEICVENKCGGCKYSCQKAPGAKASSNPFKNAVVVSSPKPSTAASNIIDPDNCPANKPKKTCPDTKPCATIPCLSGQLCVEYACGSCQVMCVDQAKLAPAYVKRVTTASASAASATGAKAKTCSNGKPELQCLLPPCLFKACAKGKKCAVECGSCQGVCK